jgi:hemolysin III
MDYFQLREPVSAWSHCAWFLLSIPGTMLLYRGSRGDRPKQLSLLVYGTSLAACAGASTLFHAAWAGEEAIAFMSLLDHVGIYLLIAGTYTPIAWNLLEGGWRRSILGMAWSAAAAGSALQLGCRSLPISVATALYLCMGWATVFCYSEIARILSRRRMVPIITGGLVYSVGAVLNVLEWPILLPGIFEAHEVFHLFVVAGSAWHFWFMWKVVVPFHHEPIPSALAARPSVTAGVLFPRIAMRIGRWPFRALSSASLIHGSRTAGPSKSRTPTLPTSGS